MRKKYDVITVGSGTVDVFVLKEIHEINRKISFEAGSKVPLKNIYVTSGGGGTNTACCMSLLGVKTAFVGKVGSGSNSNIVLRDLKKFGVDFLGKRSKRHTGFSFILRSDKRHRTIFYYKGASDHLKFKEIDLKKINTDWLFFTNVGGSCFRTQATLAEYANKHKIKIAFNPGINGIEKGMDRIKKILEHTFFLNLNMEEAALLLGKKSSPRVMVKKLLGLGPKIVCITNGKRKGYLSAGSYLYEFKPKGCVRVVGETGAGDVFASSFVAGLVKLKSIERALHLALINSEAVLGKIGSKNGILSLEAAKNQMKQRTYAVTKSNL